jgi:putative inorganic carbon (HCO3(-)) transporter
VTVQAAARRQRTAFWLFWGHLVTLFGLALSNVLLGLAILVTPWRRCPGALRSRVVRPLLWTLALYLAVLAIAVGFSVDPARSAPRLGEILSFPTLLLGLCLIRDLRQARMVVDGVVGLATGLAVLGLGQYLAAGGATLSDRIRGPLSHYMTFSGVLLVADLLLVARLLEVRRWADWRSPALVVINLALFASLTRSAWVGLVAGLVVLVWLAVPRLLLAAPVAGVLFLLLAPVPVVHRAVTIIDASDPTNYDRLCMAAAGLRMIRERPLVGQGPGMARIRYPIYRDPTAARYEIPHLHDSFLQLAAERGLPALVAYLAMMGVVAHQAYRQWRRRGRRGGGALGLGVLAVLVGFNVAGIFEDNWSDAEVKRLVIASMALPFVLAASKDELAEPEEGV